MSEIKRGWKRKKTKWLPYQPTPFDLARDPSLAEQKPTNWESYRKFKADQRRANPPSREDICYRNFRRCGVLKVSENDHGTWDIKDENNAVISTHSTNAAAWREMEKLELRERGRRSSLYQSDAATVKRK